MILKEITEEELDKFVSQHKKSHFLQSPSWGKFAKEKKHLEPYYLGLIDEKNNIVAASLLLEKKLPLKYSYFYAPRGFIIDYNNKELLKEMTNQIVKFVRTKRGIFIKIDPDIKLQDLNLDGQKVGEKTNYELINYLKTLGYKHLGFNKAFEHNQPRYTFRLDLTKGIDKIKNDFHSTTKKIIKKGNPYELQIEKNDEKYINDFYKTMQETADRENIAIYEKGYYSSFYKDLHKNNHSDIYIVYLNKNHTLALLKRNLKELENNYNSLTSENKKKEIGNQIDKLTKVIEEIENVKEEKLPLSSIITAKYGDKVWTIHGGNSDKLRILNANYLIYYEIIKDAVKEGYKTIDFFGTSYNPSIDEPEYGIWLFKKRLGGEYTEFIGEFDYVIKPFIYLLFTKLVPIYRNLIRKKKIKETKNEISNLNRKRV